MNLDGCGSDCRVEQDADCPVVGACVLPRCGDGRITTGEECDDGNDVDNDGCSTPCRAVESGWVCPAPGFPCRPYCGDDVLVGDEPCDDGNTTSGDGCSRACRVENAAATSVCGDGVVTAPEDCDAGERDNDGRYGGCNADCTFAAFCGDGMKNGPELCDTWPEIASYGYTDGCSMACRPSGFCGDGIVDRSHDEVCDEGAQRGGACRACLLEVP